MNNKLEILDQREVLGKEFRIYGDKDNPLFLAKDVADWIDYDSSSVNKMINKVDEEEKLNGVIFRAGQNREFWFLTEDGVYEVLMQSRKPIAKAFKKEVKKILKAIRKTGGYISNTDLMINTYFGALDESHKGLVKSLFQNIENQQKQIIEKDKEITYLKPKATYCDEILKSVDTVTITQIAKDYGMSAIKLNSLLNDMKIQFKSSGQWLLYSKYHGKGYTKSETAEYDGRTGNKHTKVYTKWTQKGRMFLYEKLKENNILPLIEVA